MPRVESAEPNHRLIALQRSLLVPPADPGALSEALRLLLSNPDLCHQMGQAGRERVLKNFTWRRTAERMAQAYEEVRREAALKGPA